MKSKLGVLIVGIIVIIAQFTVGCAAGAATAGYAVKAGTADSLNPSGMKSIIDIAKAQSDAHTDLGVGKLKSDLETKILNLDLRIKKLETK